MTEIKSRETDSLTAEEIAMFSSDLDAATNAIIDSGLRPEGWQPNAVEVEVRYWIPEPPKTLHPSVIEARRTQPHFGRESSMGSLFDDEIFVVRVGPGRYEVQPAANVEFRERS